MSEQENYSIVSRLQLLMQYLQALDQEDIQTANNIFGIIHSDARMKNIISEINIAYQQEDSTSDILRTTKLLTGKVRLAIIEGNDIIRTGIRIILSESPDIEVVGEATSYFEALLLLQQQQPDVAIINIDLPGKNGIELMRELRQSNNRVKAIILSRYKNVETVLSAFAAGANSYCMKDIQVNHLLEAIHATHSGKKWIDPLLSDVVLEILQTHVGST
jgi:CheY-like chemotaxis protein